MFVPNKFYFYVYSFDEEKVYEAYVSYISQQKNKMNYKSWNYLKTNVVFNVPQNTSIYGTYQYVPYHEYLVSYIAVK